MCLGARTANGVATGAPHASDGDSTNMRPLRGPRLPRGVTTSPRVDLNRLWGHLEQFVPCHVSWTNKPQAVEGDGDDDNAANENRLNEQKERAQRERDRARRRKLTSAHISSAVY